MHWQAFPTFQSPPKRQEEHWALKEKDEVTSPNTHTSADGWQTFPIYAIIDKLWQANAIE